MSDSFNFMQQLRSQPFCNQHEGLRVQTIVFRQSLRMVFLSLVFLSICCHVPVAVAALPGADATEAKHLAAPTELNLRLVWGGARPMDYAGQIEIDDGKIACTQSLGIDPFDASYLLKDTAGKIPFRDRATRFGGCDLHVQAKPNSRLTLTMQVTDPTTQQYSTKEYSWSISELRDQAHTEVLDLSECKVSIDRVPGDRLRAVTTRSHLIYNAEEPLALQIQPYALPWLSTNAKFECSLVRSEDGTELLQQSRTIMLDEQGHSEPVSILLPAPKEEGVYELRCKLEPKRTLPGLIVKHPYVERVVQFVVYDNAPAVPELTRRSPPAIPTGSPSSAWQVVHAIEPASFEMESLTHHLLGQVDSARRFPILEMARSFSIGRRESRNEQQSNDQLSVAENSVASVTLHDLVPGKMHRLVVGSSGPEASFRVALSPIPATRDRKAVEPTYVSQLFESSPERLARRVTDPQSVTDDEQFEVLFWPTQRTAKLELSNLLGTKLQISQATVHAWQHSMGHASLENSHQSNSSVLELLSPNVRGVFADSVKQLRPTGYDDWNSFLHFAEATADYCNANGFHTLAMSVGTEGGTLFPTSKFSSNPRFDTGVFHGDGRDPFKKDIVELLYRVMSRHQITFVPMLELNSAIRELDESSAKSEDVDLWQDRLGANPESFANPRLYNPLSARVQRALASCLDEFETRYKSHATYAGFAIRMTDKSHLKISQSLDKTNLTILDRFASETGGNIPRDSTQREQFINQHANAMYVHWIQSAALDFLSKLRAKPQWISFAKESDTLGASRELKLVAPINIDYASLDAQQVIKAILCRWNSEHPKPIHVSMERPAVRFESSIQRFNELCEPFQTENVRSLPNREGANSLSRVRVWLTDESNRGMLIANSGAVSETIHLLWESLPTKYHAWSLQRSNGSESPSLIDANSNSNEWRVTIPAGEIVVVELSEEFQPASKQTERSKPLHWYSQDTITLRSVDVALQSMEQAINRLSIPQPRADLPTNPSFESNVSATRRGGINGWTTSLDPSAVVSVDSVVASHGNSSIKIQSDKPTSIAWLQSDLFALSACDRLAISFQALSQQLPDEVTLSLSKFEPKSERFELVASRTIADRLAAAKQPSNWNVVSFDLSKEVRGSFDSGETLLFRLQFEAKGNGTIWFDDVAISTDFLREEERRDFRSELFLARSSLKNGDSSPAISMLSSQRGRLVAWGDASYAARKQSNSQFANQGDGPAEDSPRIGLPISADQKVSDRIEPKNKPAKRSRGFWWQRKD